MIRRLKFELENLAPTVIGKIPERIITNPNALFIDPAMGGGQYVKSLIERLREGFEESNIKHRVFGYESNSMRVQYAINKHKLIGTFLPINFLLESEKNNMPRFDCGVLNPPYDGFTHLKFFNLLCVGNETQEPVLLDDGFLVQTHPSTSWLNRKPGERTSVESTAIDTISRYESSIELLDGNKIFNASFFTPISITTVDKSKTNSKINVIYRHFDSTNSRVHTVDSIDEVYLHGNDIVHKIRRKIEEKMNDNIENHLYRNGARGKYYLRTNAVVGHPPKNGKPNPDFYCVIYKKDENNIDKIITTKPDIHKRKDANGSLAGSSRKELNNVANYLMTKFARFCVSFYKISANMHYGELGLVPWLDFSRTWTDEQLFKYFELTKKEQEFIVDYIGKWYDRD